ncbi:MAG: M48 family metalloprotease [Candidatus Cloacimonadota bacterium]|nr:M48 family metalloprotease [Candidatus Cloacimonadota bacterium]
MKYLTLFILLAILVATSTIQIQRDNVIVRNGPGIFYDKLGELDKNESIEMKKKIDNWLEIKYQNKAGFISQKSIVALKKNSDLFKKLGTQKTDLIISKHGVSAGVKGFAARTNRTQERSNNFLTYLNNYNLNHSYYQAFKHQIPPKNKIIKIPDKTSHSYFSEAEIIFGKKIAEQIANYGIYENKQVQDYVNAVGMNIVESTEMYDQLFKFFILDTEKLNAYACPGGIIFVTKGLLTSLKNEAELCVTLAHEITHCIRQHGLEETKNRKTLIKAENSFSELDAEMDEMGMEQDEDITETEQELENELMDFYDKIFDGRLMEYEYEADYYATIYTARCGYNPNTLFDILHRLISQNAKSTNDHFTNHHLIRRNKELLANGIVTGNFDYRNNHSARFNKYIDMIKN